MILPESIERINYLLERDYGKLSEGFPFFRVVWSELQFEKRLITNTDSGFELVQPKIREVPKYRQWIQKKYILEALKMVPIQNENELPTSNITYEPLWVFQDKEGKYLPPLFRVCVFVLEQLRENENSNGKVKYKDPESSEEESLELKEKRIKAIEELLFGNESNVGDAMAHNQAVIVPGVKES